MSGVCHIVCAGPGEVALLAEHDDGDGGVAAERFPYEPKAPVTLSCEHRTMSAAATSFVPSASTLRYLLQRSSATTATAAKATESSMGNTHESLMGKRLVFIP